jgi:hypothetical protein
MAKKVLNVQEQLAAHQAGKAAAEQALDEVTSKWLENPKSPELIAEREGLKQEIELLDLRIARAQAALAAAAAADTAEAKAEATRRIEAEFAEIERRHVEIAARDQKLAELFDAMAPVLAERQQLADDNAASGWAIARACSDKPERVFGTIERHLRATDARAPLLDRLFASGVGRTGIDMLQWVEITPARTELTLDDVARRSADASLKPLRKLIEARKARLEGEQA